MDFKIVESSPKAQQTKAAKAGTAIYPFDSLEVNQSFTVETANVNWKSLRICVYQHNARSKGTKEFIFLKHDDLGVCEVARIA